MCKAALERERLELQARLKGALQLHMAPTTHLDTASPIDRTVALLDGLLEVRGCSVPWQRSQLSICAICETVGCFGYEVNT